MEKVAFISNGTFIYWGSIILTIAAVVAIAAFVALYFSKSGNSLAISIAVPVSFAGSLVLSRLVHWCCNPQAYESLGEALTDYSAGGYALAGVFAACLLCALVLRLVGVVKDLPQMLDCMAIAGGAGIAVGRLASFFNGTARGMIVAAETGLPFAYQMTNAVTGQEEVRLATFMIQAIAAAVIVGVLLLWTLFVKMQGRKVRNGDVFLLFLAAYGGSQILLDSTRIDSLYLGGSGFFSLVQILGLAALVLAAAVFSVRLIRTRGVKPIYYGLWVMQLVMVGAILFAESHVQKNSNDASFGYTLMGIAIAVTVIVTLVLRLLSEERVDKAARAKAIREIVAPEVEEVTAPRKPWTVPVSIVSVTVLCALSVVFMGNALLGGLWCRTTPESTGNSALMDKFDMYMTNEISKALDGVLSVEKVYWLSDSDLVAPEPNQACFGTAKTAAELQWLLDDAQEILEGQDTLFTTETPVWKDAEVMYYLDETIFAVTWKQQLGGCIYTFSEVKIADASQFRRFLAGGEYGSDKQYTTTEMAASVNAVVASSGDFYKHRRQGVIVYDGTVQRVDGLYVDTCYIDDKGDMIFSYRGDITTMEQAQNFVDENNIRFSVAFGPILIDDYERVVPYGYALGEIDDHFPRAALGQRDELHYVIVVCNQEYGYNNMPTIWSFTNQVEKMGCKDVYTLDGGQTGVIAMNDKLINAVHFGTQRQISDIIYFATALQDGG